MATNSIDILLLGATGYIGGTILSKLLDHPSNAFPAFNITAIVRSPEKAEKLQALEVNVITGSLTDESLLESLAAQSDVVIEAADADNLQATQTVLRGLKKRHEETGKVGVLIHTSGTGVLTDDAKGMYPSDTMYDDMNPAQIESLAPTQIHRNVDLAVLDADRQGYVKTYIVLPATIYGLAKSKLVDLGIQNPHSLQIPQIIRASLARGQGGMVGQGKNVWPNVHIDDVADIYVKLLDTILGGKNPGHGREGFYFGENGEHTLYDLCKRISEILVERGRGKDVEPTSFAKEEIDKYLEGTDYLGTNSRCKSNRARKTLGWTPSKTTKDLFESLTEEVDTILAEKSA